MSMLCLCLTGRTIQRDLQVLDKYRDYVDVAELRVDFLDQDERLHIRRFPALAGVPTILTVRRGVDGGRFTEGEGARIVLLASGLAYADSDSRRNFAYVDIEEDMEVPSLEEAARTFGTRIIRSFHDFQGVPEDLATRIRRLRRTGDEIAKVAVMPAGLSDVAAVFRAADETRDQEKIVLAMGPHGSLTRVLAERMGSIMSFSSPRDESDLESAGPGQFDPVELSEIYHFQDCHRETRIFGVLSGPGVSSSSPAIHNPAFRRAGIDAVYLPFPAQNLEGFFELADVLGLEGASVTVPYKESILPRLSRVSPEAESVGACNTILRTPAGWSGFNTDAAGFSASLLDFLGKKSLRRRRMAIVGAGGAARAVAATAKRLGIRACVVNRTVLKAKDLAERFGFAWGGLDERGMDLVSRFSDIIVQTSSAGMTPNEGEDPLALYRFTGREHVFDLVYKPPRTKLLSRAESAGCAIRNGQDMLERQAALQFRIFTGLEYPRR